MARNEISKRVTEVRVLYNRSLTAKVILDDFASRTNNARQTKLVQLRFRLREFSLPNSEVVAFFRALESLEFGRFFVGRKGHPTRFEWTAKLTEVGRAAVDQNVVDEPSNLEVDLGDGQESLREYVFPLRAGSDFIFSLPVDLTLREAERITAYISTLPI